MKKVNFVSGVDGSLGSNIAKELISRGEQVVGLTYDDRTNSLLRIEGLDKQITFVRGDICDFMRMRELLALYEVTHIYHCAAWATIQICKADPLGCFKTNIIGTATILEAARLTQKVQGILCMESDKSYGAFDPKDLPYREDQGLKPQGIYDASKAATSFVALSYWHNFKLPVFTVRTANMYGPGDFNSSRLIVGSILRLLNNEAPVMFEGVKDYIREFLYIEDAARIVIGLMDRIEKTAGYAYNVGSGYKYTVAQVMNTLTEISNLGIQPVIKSSTNDVLEIKEQYLDRSRLMSVLPGNITNCLELHQGLPKTFEWYRKFVAPAESRFFSKIAA